MFDCIAVVAISVCPLVCSFIGMRIIDLSKNS